MLIGLLVLAMSAAQKVDGAYVYDAYGESDTNVSVDVKGGVGAINLKVVQ